MPDKALKKLSKQYHVSVEQLQELLQLLQDEQGVHYVLRYRKDLAAHLSAQDLDDITEQSRQLESLAKEQRKILKKLAHQEVLTDDLQQRIESAETMRELIDYYVPFRPRKHSWSRQALAQGLEPLARAVLGQDDTVSVMGEAAEPYVQAEKGLADVGAVLDGVFHIICDWLAEEKTHRDRQRALLREQASVVSHSTGKSASPRIRGEMKAFVDFQAKIKELHPAQILSLLRGRRMKVIEFRVEAPLLTMCRTAAALYTEGGEDQFDHIDARFHDAEGIPEGEALRELNVPEFLYFCIRQSLCEVLAPILVRELERELARSAEEFAAGIVQRNLRSLLMAEPLRGRRVLGIWPGYRTGCKLAALDESGGVMETDTVYPHAPQSEVAKARERIVEMVRKHSLGAAAIGAATAAQETEALLSRIIAEDCPDLRYATVNDMGVTAYCEGQVGQSELPELGAGLRAAVSVGRRLLDPLSELVKVNLRTICSSQYAQDVTGAALKDAITRVIQECIVEVGLDLDSATEAALKFVPGLNGVLAAELVAFRNARGPLAGRADLRDVPKLDENAWRKSVGFLRVSGGANPLDRTRIHPDHYPVAEKTLELLGVAAERLGDEEASKQIADKRGGIDFGVLEAQFGVHYLVFKDILDELEHPWPDPRGTQAGPVLRSRQLGFDDLESGQMLMGTVRKVVDFGVFVDVGVSEDGLVHISELSDRFVRSPYDVVGEGDLVKVRVVEVDAEKRRIALSMRSEDKARRPARRPVRRHTEPDASRVARPKAAETTAGATPGSGVRQPQSTLGTASRRIEKARLKTDKPDAGAGEREAAKAKKESSQPAPKASELLGKLDFASIEKRGKGKPEDK